MIGAVTWNGITLLDAGFLLLLPLLALAVLWRLRRPRAALPTACALLFDDAPRTLRQRLAFVPLLARALAGACLIVALARPVERELVPLADEGIDILLVVDTSSSMLAEDMRPGQTYRRIDAARDRALEFAAARSHDRVGLLSFARFAELRCPLTLDEAALAAFLRVLETVPVGSDFDNTAIGVAVMKAVDVLAASEAESRVVVLLSDGENLMREILPEEAAAAAADAGIRVHTIGLGTGVSTPFGLQPLRFDALRTIAEATGGEFFRARDDDSLAEVYDRIDALETTEREDPRFRTVDCFHVPLGIGLALLLFAVLIEAVWLWRVP